MTADQGLSFSNESQMLPSSSSLVNFDFLVSNDQGLSFSNESQMLPSSSSPVNFDMLVSNALEGSPETCDQQQPLFDSPQAEMRMKHFQGECSPCAYFYKHDSCRW